VLGRRFLLIVAVLMGLTALAASVAPRDPSVREDRADRRATPSPTPAAGSSEAIRTVRQTISATAPSERVVVTEGDLLELEVSATELDSVTLLEKVDPVEPGSNARFNLLADTPGQYPIALLDSERQIATLVVREAP
jgi:hypothetical protein